MEIPKGVKFEGINRNEHCLHVTKNVYGGRESGRTWFLFMKKGLIDLGFKQSKFDECVFYRGTTTFLVYTDDGIILDPKKQRVDQVIKDIKSMFNIEDQGDLADYLGVKVQRHKDGAYEMTQPHLIDSILMDLGLIDERGAPRKGVTTRDMPALSTRLVGPDKGGPSFNYEWGYRSVIGKLNFLEKSTRCDISYIVHQCARFSSDPRQSHGEAIKHLGRYLLQTRKQGYFLKPAQLKSFDCYVDEDFCGNWDRTIATKNVDTAKSRTGFIIMYAGAPVYWASKLQTQIALSTAESELLALSTASRFAKSLMYLLEEIKAQGNDVTTVPTIHCNAWEDNSAALTIANMPKMRPRMRHINCIYHHFRSEYANKRLKINVLPIGTKDQLGDTFTKQADKTTFIRHRKLMMGW